MNDEAMKGYTAAYVTTIELTTYLADNIIDC